jgi:hypothetical protein
MASTNETMTKKLALYESQKQLSDLNASELVTMAFTKNEGYQVIWRAMKRNLSEEQLKEIAVGEFEQIISEITE